MTIKQSLPLVISCLFVGCASVPQADAINAQKAKQLAPPSDGNAAIYVYRSNSVVGAALKKDVWLDGKCLGETARGTFFYKEVLAGNHTLSTESEFSPNHLVVNAESGKQYFVQQYIKPGVFVGGANLKLVDDAQGKKAIGEYTLAQDGNCSKSTVSLSQ
ncbi:DUF2846 domain-containing protein [Acinetobacter baylyi]|uniref:DUF2846 domain-containing protein n=1 Tax=Acinetobacter baylyi TaxID=202950 RepID=UPI000EA318FE|nr:DUF2846 domain-containing protein [Acinetobacter baylyi]